MPNDLKNRKLMPLNQTARSDTLVHGNPVTTRADATVENTFPGLEFDHRNLEKQFLDGLLFELHAGSGGWLRDYDRGRGFPFAEADYEAGLMIWAVVGNLRDPDAPSGSSQQLRWGIGAGGSAIFQIIREFEPGPVAVVLGPRRSAADFPSMALQEQILQALRAGQNMAIPLPGEPPVVVLLGQRAAYLKDGVIDSERYEPGDLTRSLCSPWQYDFTDCGCWYWASNKPDMVAVTPDGPQIYNFQRLRTGEIAPEPPTHPPVVSQQLWGRGHAAGTPVSPEERVPRQMNHADLITGWEVLPVVIDDRETDRMVARPAVTLPDSELFLDLATIVDRLVNLAGIEHALMIEYLYAHYSIDSSRRRPAPDDTGPLRLFEAANTILSVAIDEMRHFRWVNEILVMLGQPPAVRRALRTEDKDNNGRFLDHDFSLTPANQARIDWFIRIEQGSQDVDPGVQSDTIDGMYTRLLLSIERSDEIADEIKERVQHLIKLIIDEGYEHYHRFQRVRQLLPQPPDESYLRILEDPQPLADTHPAKGLEDRVNRSYEVILNLLLVLFGRGDAEHGQLLEATRIAMVDSLDMESLNLILAGGAPLFVLPDLSSEVNLGLFSAGPGLAGLPGPMVARTAGDAAGPEAIVRNATRPLDAVNEIDSASNDPGHRLMAERSAAAMSQVRAAFLTTIRDGEE